MVSSTLLYPGLDKMHVQRMKACGDDVHARCAHKLFNVDKMHVQRMRACGDDVHARRAHQLFNELTCPSGHRQSLHLQRAWMRRRVEMMQQLCEESLPKTVRAQCDATRRRSDAYEPLVGLIHPLRTLLGPPCIISPTHTANLYL